MSFSGEVKEELAKLQSDARHCQLAELAAILVYARAVKTIKQGGFGIEIQSDVPYTAKKCFTLLEKTFKIEGGGYNIAQQPNILKYYGKQIPKILQAVKYLSTSLRT